jgi:hypothetical protein
MVAGWQQEMCRMMMSYMRGNIFSLKCGAHYPVHRVMLISILVSAMLDHNQVVRARYKWYCSLGAKETSRLVEG